MPANPRELFRLAATGFKVNNFADPPFLINIRLDTAGISNEAFAFALSAGLIVGEYFVSLN